MERVDELRSIVRQNPGAVEFVELAQLLSDTPEGRKEAREVCFRGLSEDPRNTRGRLTLARLFYLDGFGEFSVRELIELQRYVESSEALSQLIAGFGDFAKRFLAHSSSFGRATSGGVTDPGQNEESKVMAELDLDAEFADLLEDIADDE